MRRRLPALAAALATLGVLVLGFCLPRVVFGAMDRRLAGERRKLEIQDVSLSKPGEADFYDLLRLMGGEHTEVALSQGENLTVEEAAQLAEEMLRNWLPPEVWIEDAEDVQADPVLVTSREEMLLSGIFWRCTWTDPWGEQNMLYLEDRSGGLASFRFFTTHWYKAAEDVIAEIIMGLRYYFMDNYQAEMTQYEPSLFDLGAKGEGYLLLYWPNGEQYEVPLRWEDERFSFNEPEERTGVSVSTGIDIDAAE